MENDKYTINGSTSGDSKTEFAIDESGKVQRGNWGGKFEFILTCVGYAVGLGNVWRFPYLCYKNGGGAFLIPYVIMLVFVGLPLFFMELAFGQFASLGPITIWRVSPIFKGLGFAMVIVSALIGLYYNVIIAYCLFYFFSSMTLTLPWVTCDNEWNTPSCVVYSSNQNGNVSNLTDYMTTTERQMTTNITAIPSGEPANKTYSPSEEYFNNYVLGLTSGMDEPGGLKWQLTLCLLLAWCIVFFVLIRGIKSLGKVVYFTAIFPYILLTVLLVRGATLPGSLEGIKYYVTPNWERLSDSTVWSDAAVQIFYSLSACSGGLIAMASFNKFNNNCLRDALLVPFINCGTSIYSGFVIFSVLGFMAHERGVDVKDVATGGPGLTFVVYPEGLAKMPAAPMWAILFFFMMITLGFSSQFSIMETVISSIMDEFSDVLRAKKLNGYLFRIAVCFVFFLLGIPMTLKSGLYLLNIVDTYVGGFPLLFVGLFECIAINWVYGYGRFAEDISMMLGSKPNIYWKVTWCGISPFIMLGTIVFKAWQYEDVTLGSYHYPGWALALGWLICLFPIVIIPGWIGVRLIFYGGLSGLQKSIKPRKDWGPANPENRTGRYSKPDENMPPAYGRGHVNYAMDSERF